MVNKKCREYVWKNWKRNFPDLLFTSKTTFSNGAAASCCSSNSIRVAWLYGWLPWPWRPREDWNWSVVPTSRGAMRGYERAEKIVWHNRTFGRYCSISGSIVPLRAIRISEGTLLQVDKWSTKSLNAEMSFCNARLYLTRQTLYKRPSGWGTACTELCKSLIRHPPPYILCTSVIFTPYVVIVHLDVDVGLQALRRILLLVGIQIGRPLLMLQQSDRDKMQWKAHLSKLVTDFLDTTSCFYSVHPANQSKKQTARATTY